jgi:hypothetical protein
MKVKKVDLAAISLPDFGLPRQQPTVNRAEYETRIEAARARAVDAGFDFLLVYGDREHFANLAYLTDHDPRFEEALLVISAAGGKPVLLLGNEGLGYSELSEVNLDRRLYQGFSLPGQSRSKTPRLEPVLRDCGIQEGSQLGLVGWKYATPEETDDPEHWLDAPAFIVDGLRGIAGDPELVTNATEMFINPVNGLRTVNSADQLAAFEFAAAYCSQAIRDAVENLRPGMSELEVVRTMRLSGLPQSVHLMFSTGPRAHLGLPSPTTRVIQRGDPFFTALGLRGGLTARGGFVVADESELPTEIEDYLDRLVKPYFAAAVAWYEHVEIGVSGAVLQLVVDDALAGYDIRAALNPGHLIHLEEWVHSPVYPGSDVQLRSGMLIQCDIIPEVESRYHTTNLEDTIALANQSLREQLASEYPEMWQRIQARRAFMQEVIGIRIKPEVLPFSNMASALIPFALSPNMAMVSVS